MSDRTLNFTISGEGEPLVLLHGLGGNGGQWQSLLPPDFPYQLMLPDLPGHGETRWLPDDGCSFKNFAEGVNKWLDSLRVEEVVLGGISMGAGIAVRLALTAPERVKKLILVRPAWLDKSFPENLLLLRLIGEWLRDTDKENAEQQLLLHPYFKALQLTNPSCAAAVAGQLNRPELMLASRTLLEMTQDSPVSNFAEIAGLNIPALVIGNAADPLHPLSMAVDWAQHLPAAAFLEIPSRYMSPVAHQQGLLQAINGFLTDLP